MAQNKLTTVAKHGICSRQGDDAIYSIVSGAIAIIKILQETLQDYALKIKNFGQKSLKRRIPCKNIKQDYWDILIW